VKNWEFPLQNPEIVAIPNQKYQYKTIENPVISCEILKTDTDDAEKKEKNHKKEFNDNDPLPVEICHFYDHMLK